MQTIELWNVTSDLMGRPPIPSVGSGPSGSNKRATDSSCPRRRGGSPTPSRFDETVSRPATWIRPPCWPGGCAGSRGGRPEVEQVWRVVAEASIAQPCGARGCSGAGAVAQASQLVGVDADRSGRTVVRQAP